MDGWMDEKIQLYSDVLQTWKIKAAVVRTVFFCQLKILIFAETWQLNWTS